MPKKDDSLTAKNFAKFEEVVAELQDYFELPVTISFELGRSYKTIGDLLNMEPGYIIDLKKSAGENLDIYVNDQLAMKGEVAILEDSFNIRITEILDPSRKI
jgi:flagellar motor switch protein FliN/FliY